jgi:hypothetical protein
MYASGHALQLKSTYLWLVHESGIGHETVPQSMV